MSKFNGKNITLEIYGESHAEKIGVKAKKLLKKLVAQNGDMVQDLVYKYNIDPTF